MSGPARGYRVDNDGVMHPIYGAGVLDHPVDPHTPDGAGEGTPVDWSKKTVDELKAEIAERNEDRADADAIEVKEPGNKPQLLEAIAADDAAQAAKAADEAGSRD